MTAWSKRVPLRISSIAKASWMSIPPAIWILPSSTTINNQVTVATATAAFFRMFLGAAFENLMAESSQTA